MPDKFRGDNKQIMDELATKSISEQVNQLSSACLEDLEIQDFKQAFKQIQQIVYLGNNLLASNEFWTLAKTGVEN